MSGKASTDRLRSFRYHIFGLMNILAAFNMQSPSYIMARFEPQAFCMVRSFLFSA